MICALILTLTACNESGETATRSVARDPIFAVRTVDPSSSFSDSMDLSTANYGTTASVPYTRMTGVIQCACTVVITGDANSGTVELGSCVNITSTPACNGATNWETLEYNFSTFGIRSLTSGFTWN